MAPRRGEIWEVAVEGESQLVLVISENGYNEGAAGIVMALTVTREPGGIRYFQVDIDLDDPGVGPGAVQRAYAKVDSLQPLDRAVFVGSPTGAVDPEALAAIEDGLCVLLDLYP